MNTLKEREKSSIFVLLMMIYKNSTGLYELEAGVLSCYTPTHLEHCM